MAHESGPPAAVRVAPERQDPLLTSCDQSVVRTIFSSRAPSTRLLYANRWKLFSQWCVARGEVPETCSVVVILHFLQSVLDNRRAASTLRVYMAAISATHARVDNQTVGSHYLITQFLKGAQRLQPPRSLRAPSWDLQVALRSLCLPPFEPLSQADLTRLSMKTAFLLAIATAKRVGELHALSVSQACLRWHADGSGVVLWPNPSFLPKRLSPHHVNQSIELAAFNPPGSPGGAERVSDLLCPVRALRAYVEATTSFRKTDNLSVCYGGCRKGAALSKQRLSHWIVDVDLNAYRAQGLPGPGPLGATLPGVWLHHGLP